jgi:hypothetical protein
MMLDNFKDRGVDHNCGIRQFQHMNDLENYPAHYNWTDGINVGSVAVAYQEYCYAQCYPGWHISQHHYSTLTSESAIS